MIIVYLGPCPVKAQGSCPLCPAYGPTVIKYRRKQERDATAAHQNFWGYLQGFTHAKKFNLRNRLLEGITVTNQGILLLVLRNIECLELSMVFSPTGKKVAVLIADLLSCCPTLPDLQVNLTTSKEDYLRGPEYNRLFLERKLCGFPPF